MTPSRMLLLSSEEEAIRCALRTWRALCPGSQFRNLADRVGKRTRAKSA